MANFHLTAQMISRQGGKSCVAAIAYRSATKLVDQRTGETWDYTKKSYVNHVEILIPEGVPTWISDIAQECQSSRQSALKKFSDICEAAEKRKDSQVYREVEFSLPNELTPEQNIEWANTFVNDIFVNSGMVAVMNFHFDIDPKTGIKKPHCHTLLTTRELTEDGFGLKNRNWNKTELIDEAREQCSQYQNAALKEHGFDVQVSHLSYADRDLDIDAQTKLGSNVREMTARGIETDKQQIFDVVRLKNQFKIIKHPEIVFSIVTSKHSTFTRKDIAKVLHRYIDDANQFQTLLDRLMASKELVDLESSGIHKDTHEPVYTTREMLRIEMNLIKKVEDLAAQNTHEVNPKIIQKIISQQNEKLAKYGGLSADQQAAIRHMLSGDQISCVVGFAGAGKTTCLEATKEAWEDSGYKVIGLAPTGKAARNMEDCGIRAMTIHKFLRAQSLGREQITGKSIIVLDEAGMVDSRRCSELLSIIDQTGAKIVPMGDGHQAQSVEAGPAFRLLTERVKPAVLETIVRQQIEWQKDATRLFGTQQTKSALKLYQENGCFTTIQEKLPDFNDRDSLLDNFCLSRQISGRIWKEMIEDCKQKSENKDTFNLETDIGDVKNHQDFELFQEWKQSRQDLVKRIIADFQNQRPELEERGVDVKALSSLVAEYKTSSASKPEILQKIETILRQMSYDHIADTRQNTRQAMVDAWVKDYHGSPNESHLMLAFTNRDANKLNEAARLHMREQGTIQGFDYRFSTQRIETDDFGFEQRTYHERTFAQGDRLLFTRNDNSLNVKNGSLGTIVSIDQNKIKVQLDKVGDQEGEVVSFSPNLYPFIDNGWATTIIKAQGVTVDHVKLLASFEQYRNLAYVGMSRHRHMLNIYASSLDFWREDKIIDRLSRVQEKLSGFDYLDTHKIQEKLEEDTDTLWHLQKFQQGKDLWNAIKITALDVLNKALDRSQEDKGLKEEYQSFDHTEEMRSRDFFEYETSRKAQETALKAEKQEQTLLLMQQSMDLKRQQFEQEHLPDNQDYCSHFGFHYQHKRFPESHEIDSTYCQGTRLTTIEGRLYMEKMETGKLNIDLKKLALQAREELLQHQAAPDYIMEYGKVAGLTPTQLDLFEQHALIHRDRTNQYPTPNELENICHVIKSHQETMKGDSQTFNPSQSLEIASELSRVPLQENSPDLFAHNTYKTLIEQQEIIKIIKEKGIEALSSPTIASEVREACSERLQRLNEKIQKVKEFDLEMKALDLSRQNQRGMDM